MVDYGEDDAADNHADADYYCEDVVDAGADVDVNVDVNAAGLDADGSHVHVHSLVDSLYKDQ